MLLRTPEPRWFSLNDAQKRKVESFWNFAISQTAVKPADTQRQTSLGNFHLSEKAQKGLPMLWNWKRSWNVPAYSSNTLIRICSSSSYKWRLSYRTKHSGWSATIKLLSCNLWHRRILSWRLRILLSTRGGTRGGGAWQQASDDV